MSHDILEGQYGTNPPETGVDWLEFDRISLNFIVIPLLFGKCLYLCFVQTKTARTMKKNFTMHELSQLVRRVEQVLHEIQSLPLGKSIKKIDFECSADPRVEEVEEVSLLIKGRPTDSHLKCLESLLVPFPDTPVPGSTCGERIGLRYKIQLRSQSAVVTLRWVGLRVIDQIHVGDYLFDDRSFSSKYMADKYPLAVVYEVTPEQVRLIAARATRLAWGEGSVLPPRPDVDSFISFNKGWKLGDFFQLRKAWNDKIKLLSGSKLPAAAYVAGLYDTVFQPGEWCLPTVDEGALIYSAGLRPILSRALSKAGVSLNKNCWLMDEKSEDEAYRIHYGPIHCSVVEAPKSEPNQVLAVTALRWDELEKFTIRDGI